MAGAFGRRSKVGGVSAGFGFGHEVSNPAQSVLKLRGILPRAKVSMTRMRGLHTNLFANLVTRPATAVIQMIMRLTGVA